MAGCGSDSAKEDPDAAPPEPDAQVAEIVKECVSLSGTRLVRETLVPGTGGAQEFEIIDSKYGVRCNYLTNPDGSHTCYPTDVIIGGLRFTDENCTEGIVGVLQDSVPKAFFREQTLSADGCSSIRKYRLIGDPVGLAPAQPLFLISGDGECTATPILARDFYVATELEVSEFVSGAFGPVSGDSRISSLAFVGSDGSTMCTDGLLQDNMLDTQCRIRIDEASDKRCLPVTRGAANVTGDPTCEMTTQAVRRDSCEEQAPTFATTTDIDDCGDVTRTVLKVATSPLPEIYTLSAGECTVLDLGGDSFYPVGDSALAAGFEKVNEEIESGTDRIVRRMQVTEEGVKVFVGWYDSKEEVNCSFIAASDDKLRCLPERFSTSNFFLDNTCTATGAVVVEEDCRAVPKFSSEGISGRRTRIVALEERAPVFQIVDKQCVQRPGRAFVKTFEVGATSFEEATISVGTPTGN